MISQSSPDEAYDKTRRLPTELLTIIFDLLVDGSRRGFSSLLVLTRVCHRWREAAISRSRLWSDLALPTAPANDALLDSFFLAVGEWLSRSRAVPLSLDVVLSREQRPDVMARYLRLMCAHSPRWKDVSLWCAPILAQEAYPILSPEPHPHLESIEIKTDTPKYWGFVNHWDLARTGQALEWAPKLKRIAITYSNIDRLSLPWSHLTSLDLKILDASVSNHSSTLAESLDVDSFARTLNRCPNIVLLRLDFDGQFSQLEFRGQPPQTVFHLCLRRVTSLEIKATNLFIPAYLLGALDTPGLTSFCLNTPFGSDEPGAEDIFQEQFSTFLLSRRDTLLELELRISSFITEEDLIEDVHLLEKLRSLTMFGMGDVVGSLFLDSLRHRTMEVYHNDCKPGTFIAKPGCANRFLQKIRISPIRSDREVGDVGLGKLYVSLVEMVKSRCPGASSAVVHWNVEKPQSIVPDDFFVTARVSQLSAFALPVEDADWMREHLPEQWAILERCRDGGLRLDIH